MDNKPVWVIIDSPDGCGKTTVAKHLAEKTDSLYVTALGEGPISVAIRKRFMDTTKVQNNLDAAIWMAAALKEAYVDYIAPALANGRSVITDRWIASTYSYQMHELTTPHLSAIKFLLDDNKGLIETKPDLFIYCSLSSKEAEKRIRSRGGADRMDSLDIAEKERIDRGFRQYYRNYLEPKYKLDCEWELPSVLREAEVIFQKLQDLKNTGSVNNFF